MIQNNVKTIYVAMSGGVDSSVAAALLKKEGFNVVGVYFKPWTSSAKASDGQVSYYCSWRQDREDAMRVASILGIEFKTWDFSKEYGRQVAQYMINSYRKGITPNPDVMCNKEIKFGLFLKKALAEGADYIATGHYARLYHFRHRMSENYKLLKGKDGNKDQSYFLWTLTQKELKHCLFPIGDYTKPEVRKMAKKFSLPTHNKKDSQGVCFIGQLDMKSFLKEYIKPKAGDIKLIETDLPPHSIFECGGEIIGRHDGVYYYTIGQRHGLNIALGGGPYYVAKKDIKKNIIYVTKNPANLLNESPISVGKISWVAGEPKLPLKAEVKIRYRNQSTPAVISKNGNSKTLSLKFTKPIKAITPGQSAVFYRGEEVLGGGVIK